LSAKKAVLGLLAEIQDESNDSSAFPLLPLYPMQYVLRGGRPKKTKITRHCDIRRTSEQKLERGRPSTLLMDEEEEEEEEDDDEEEEPGTIWVAKNNNLS
jgi:hypothetical protein